MNEIQPSPSENSCEIPIRIVDVLGKNKVLSIVEVSVTLSVLISDCMKF
jgi:hypothetical protein